MKMIDIGRPAASAMIFGSLLTMAILSMLAVWAELASAENEQRAKAEFGSRIMPEVRRDPGADAGQAGRLLVEADSETMAAAEIDALVRSISIEAGGSVPSSRAAAKLDEAGIAGPIEVVAEIEGPNDVLQNIMFRLESSAPMLLVESLSIHPMATTEGIIDQEPRLHLDVKLTAYWNNSKK